MKDLYFEGKKLDWHFFYSYSKAVEVMIDHQRKHTGAHLEMNVMLTEDDVKIYVLTEEQN